MLQPEMFMPKRVEFHCQPARTWMEFRVEGGVLSVEDGENRGI
jgi:hypothetical protein